MIALSSAELLAEEWRNDVRNGHSLPGRLVRASSVVVRQPTWVYDGRIPVAGVTLLAGREGLGKTALLGHLSARLTRGQLPGAFCGIPKDVVYVGVEDDRESVLVPRLIAAGADLDRVYFLDLPDGVPFSVADDVALLGQLLCGLDVALVAIDPLDSHLGATVDAHRKAEVQRAIGRLAVTAQEHHCGLVGLAHLNKGDSRDLLARVVGSVGFTTAVRSVIGVGEHPDTDSDRVAVLAKSNLTDKAQVPALRFRVEGVEIDHPDGGTIDTAGVVILGEELGVDPDTIVSGLGSEERTQRDEAVEWIVDYLADGGVPYSELERAALADGITRATLHRAKARAGVIVERDDSRRGRPSVWRVSSADHLSHVLTPSGETKSEPLQHNGSGSTEGVWSHPRVNGTKPADDLGAWCSDNLGFDPEAARERAAEWAE